MGAFFGEKNFSFIKMHGTTIKKLNYPIFISDFNREIFPTGFRETIKNKIS